MKKDVILRKFGESVRKKREDRRHTQMQLSEMVGCSYQAIGNIERGRANPSLIMVFRIAEALNVHIRDLVDIDFF